MKMQKRKVLDENKSGCIKIGLFDGEKYIADDYDFDQDNEEIARMFEDSMMRIEEE